MAHADLLAGPPKHAPSQTGMPLPNTGRPVPLGGLDWAIEGLLYIFLLLLTLLVCTVACKITAPSHLFILHEPALPWPCRHVVSQAIVS